MTPEDLRALAGIGLYLFWLFNRSKRKNAKPDAVIYPRWETGLCENRSDHYLIIDLDEHRRYSFFVRHETMDREVKEYLKGVYLYQEPKLVWC